MTTEEAAAFLARFVADWQRTPFQGITNESTDGQRLLAALRVVLDRVADLSGRDANGLARKLADKHDELLALKAQHAELGALRDQVAAAEEGLAKQRAVNKSAAKAFMDGSAQLNAELAEANRRAEEACGRRDRALAELAELKACRPCGRSASHPPHKWMSARKALQCAGVGELPTAARPDVAQGGAEGAQGAPCSPGASPSGGRAVTEPPAPSRKSAPFGRGECAVCGEVRNLTKAGTLRFHSGDIWIAGHRQTCHGTGEPPKADPITT